MNKFIKKNRKQLKLGFYVITLLIIFACIAWSIISLMGLGDSLIGKAGGVISGVDVWTFVSGTTPYSYTFENGKYNSELLIGDNNAYLNIDKTNANLVKVITISGSYSGYNGCGYSGSSGCSGDGDVNDYI